MPLPSEILVEHLSLVERIVATICRRRGMKAEQIEEFSGFVNLRLIENDYAIVRAFKGRSSFGTYMTTVISRLLNDYRNHELGKWHDSAEAKRLGDLAVELERIIVRDNRSIDDAMVMLAARFPGITRQALEEIADRFPKRYRRRMVTLDEHLESSGAAEPDDGLTKTEIAACISRVVTRFVQDLDKDDQLLFQLRFGCDMPVPQIAKALNTDAQLLYRRLRTHTGALRAALKEEGIHAADVARVIGSDALLDFPLKNDDRRPSNEIDPDAAPEEDA